MPSVIIIFSVLAIIMFIYMLNLHLRGRYKPIIEFVLWVLIIATLVISFFITNWVWGCAAVVSSFIFAALFKITAAALAKKMLGYRTGTDDGYHNDILSELASGKDLTAIMDRISNDAQGREKRLIKIINRPSIADVISKYQVSEEYIISLFEEIWVSALHDLAWEIFESPTDLARLLEMKHDGKSKDEIWSAFREFS